MEEAERIKKKKKKPNSVGGSFYSSKRKLRESVDGLRKLQVGTEREQGWEASENCGEQREQEKDHRP